MTCFENKLLKAWDAGNSTINSWLFIGDANSTEIMAQAGFDSLCIDCSMA